MEINRQTLKQFRKDFDETMKSLEEKYDVKIGLGNISFSEAEFTSKITVVDTKGNDSGKSVEILKYENAYNQNCKIYDLKPEWLGAQFEAQGKSFQVIGLNTRASKRPVICSANGSLYSFEIKAIIRKLSNAPVTI